MSGSLKKRLRGWIAAGACAVSALAGGGAQAAVYVGNWDPLYGGGFFGATGVNLGWQFSATITVDDLCVAPSVIRTPPNLACPSALLTGYGYTLYDGIPANVIAGGGGASIVGFGTITQVSFDAGSLIDDLTMASPLSLNIFPVSIGSSTYNLEVDFTTLGVPDTLKLNFVAGTDPAVNYTSTIDPVITWTRIPEPGMLALLAGALGLLGWQRRSRQA